MEVTKKVPSLRFPGFEGEWEEKKLGEVGSKFDYGMNSAATDFDGENKYIRITDIDEISHLYLGDNPVSPLDELEECYLVKEGDILFARTGASVGKSYLYNKADEKLYFAGFLIRVSIQENYSPKFIFSQTLTDKYSRWVSVISTRSGQPGINAKEYAQLSFYCPSLPEQQKIADCLTAMDDTIEAQQQKVEQLQAYKKGLLQQLFSQTLRFPGFEGTWEAKKLGEVVQDKKKGNTPDYENPKNLLLNNDFMENQAAPMYVGNDINVKSNDLLILWDGSQAGKVYTGFEGVLGSTFVAINFDSDTSHLFIYNVLRHNLLAIQRVWREGSGIPHVAKDFIENYKIQLPSFPEQQKIADCLLTLDEVIELEQQKLEKLQVYKKGLLQQLFA